MAIGTTSSRRPRSSIGPSQDLFNEGPSQHTVDVEFRKKHSRQNKEIITENVRHKTAMKVLNEEIGSLKEEILEVKQINRILSLQMKKMKDDQKRSCSPATVQAIDALIAAMPALHVIRQSLVPASTPLPVFEAEVSRRNILRNIGMTVGTRPANTGSDLMRLGTLGEDEEEYEDSMYETRDSVSARSTNLSSPLPTANSRTGNAKSKTPPRRLYITSSSKGYEYNIRGKVKLISRTSSSPLSKAMPRSPLPPSLRPVVEISVDSPSSSAASTPAKSASTTPKKKARRRRESGLIPPVPATTDNLSPVPVPVTVPASVGAYERIEKEVAAEQQFTDAALLSESWATLEESIGSTSTAPTSFSDMSYLDEDGKRGRRSRTSVNYKEPSLAKKMRKPDGVAIAEALGRIGDKSGDFLRQPIGVRRKSMLPNSLARQSETRSDGESDTGDVDDIDACLNLDSLSRQKSPNSSSSNSTLTEPLSTLYSSRSSRDDIERVPTPIPPLHADPHPVGFEDSHVTGLETPHADAVQVDEVCPAPPLRTSPRKTSSAKTTESTRNKARRSSVVPTKTPARVAPVTGGRNRMALADVPEPNPKTNPVSRVGEGTLKPRTVARR